MAVIQPFENIVLQTFPAQFFYVFLAAACLASLVLAVFACLCCCQRKKSNLANLQTAAAHEPGISENSHSSIMDSSEVEYLHAGPYVPVSSFDISARSNIGQPVVHKKHIAKQDMRPEPVWKKGEKLSGPPKVYSIRQKLDDHDLALVHTNAAYNVAVLKNARLAKQKETVPKNVSQSPSKTKKPRTRLHKSKISTIDPNLPLELYDGIVRRRTERLEYVKHDNPQYKSLVSIDDIFTPSRILKCQAELDQWKKLPEPKEQQKQKQEHRRPVKSTTGAISEGKKTLVHKS